MSGSLCNTTFLGRFDEARLENAYKTEWNTHVIRSWWKLEPHCGGGGRRNNIQITLPPPNSSLKAKRKGKGQRDQFSTWPSLCEETDTSERLNMKCKKTIKTILSLPTYLKYFASLSVFES